MIKLCRKPVVLVKKKLPLVGKMQNINGSRTKSDKVSTKRIKVQIPFRTQNMDL